MFGLVAIFASVDSDDADAATLVEQVRDIRPGANGSGPGQLTTYAGRVYFSADGGGGHGEELWVTDGTEAGTELFADLKEPGESGPGEFTPFDGKLYFTAAAGIVGSELWSTDGSPANTEALFDEASVGELRPSGERLFMSGYAGATGFEVYAHDGGGTELVKDIALGNPSGYVNQLTGLAGRAVFAADDEGGAGTEPWISDGTEPGTHILEDINPGGSSDPYEMTNVGGVVYFNADDGSHGHELWRTDGTTTEMLADVKTGPGDSFPDEFVALGGKVYFTAAGPGEGRELWAYDPVLESAARVKDVHPGIPGSQPADLTLYDGRLYFAANDGEHGSELWASDGTEAGTELAADLNPGPEGSLVERLTPFGGKLFLVATDKAHGDEPWVSDGTAAGTAIAADVNPGKGGSHVIFTAALGEQLLFDADDGEHGEELWSLRLPPDPPAPGPPAGDAGPPAPAAAGAAVAPKLTRFRMTHKRFLARGPKGAKGKAKVGSAFRLTLSEAATVKIKIERKLRGYLAGKRCKASKPAHGKHRRCTAFRRARRISSKLGGGSHTLALDARGLKPGRYRASAYAVAGGGLRSRTARAGFTLLAP